MLGPFAGAPYPCFCTVHGCFPPEAQFNQDQVPLLLAVSTENTHTLEEDGHMHESCPRESLRKRQFAMHAVVNAGKGENKIGHTALVCKGIPN